MIGCALTQPGNQAAIWIVVLAALLCDHVFILAGQSNMEGHARVETFDYMSDDPATAPLLRQMRDASVQDIPYVALRSKLDAAKQIVDVLQVPAPTTRTAKRKSLP